MKKTFCFMFQHAASTELKQWTEAGSRGGYMNIVKVLASSKSGLMPDDRGPQGSTKKKKQSSAQTEKHDKFKFQSESNYTFLKTGLQPYFIGYSLLILPRWEQKTV